MNSPISSLSLLGALCLALPVVAQVDARSDATAPQSPANAEAAIVPRLRGIVLVRSGTPLPARVEAGIDFTPVTDLPLGGVREMLEPMLDRPLTLAEARRAAQRVQDAIIAAGRPFVRVLLPPQDVTDGVLRFEITEGRVGEIRVEGARWFHSDDYTAALPLRSGDPITRQAIEDAVAWIGRNASRRVSVDAAPGKNPGTTDLTLVAQESRPWRIFAGASNTGTRTTANERLFFGANWDNAFGQGHQMSYQLTASPDFETSLSQSVSYTIPLARLRHILSADVAYSEIRPELAPPFASAGYAAQASLRYEIPLRVRSSSRSRYTHGWSLVAEAKQTDNNIEFGGLIVTDNTTRVVQFGIGYGGQWENAAGTTAFSVRLTASPGGLGRWNDDEAFTGSRFNARANYAYLSATVEHLRPLPQGFALSTNVTGQVSNRNLLGSEQLSFGGGRSVRGYLEGEVYSDGGAFAQSEIQTPNWSPRGGRLVARAVAFGDVGWARVHDPLPGERAQFTLASLGLGLRIGFGRTFSARVDHGWQLRETGLGDGRGRRTHVSATLFW